MRPSPRTQIPLFLALCAFTAVTLTPVVWAIMTSFKRPVDAFAVPPTIIFTPTFEFHYQVWVEKAFWRFLINSAVVSICTVLISVSIGTMAAYGLARLRSTASRGVLFAILSMRMFPHICSPSRFSCWRNGWGLSTPIPR
jgi:multiple sugar transport system permease protein